MTEQIQALMLALCLKEKECPNCEAHKDEHGMVQLGNCPLCQLSSSVPLLDPALVREKCPECEGTGRGEQIFDGVYGSCDSCQGRGWVPSTDPWKYGEAIEELIEAEILEDSFIWDMGLAFLKGRLAFCQALAKALGVEK